MRHNCWDGGCITLTHSSFDEYEHDEDHGYADGGSVAVSADGRQVGIERVLLAVSPSGRRLLTVDVGQWSLCLHDEDGACVHLWELAKAD
ncbi:hypothetical protein [Streptomyces collinus]|uniref:hypothetical protein n=1 Tax=Streptomyces collinus TaxID=42684 RepID=UPI003645ECB8